MIKLQEKYFRVVKLPVPEKAKTTKSNDGELHICTLIKQIEWPKMGSKVAGDGFG